MSMMRTISLKRTRSIGILAFSLAVLQAGAGLAQSGAVADFYRGKTVNLVIGTVVGGEYDLHARLIGRFIGRHIP